MSHALTGTALKLVDHRLLWWLLQAQERDDAGAPTGVVPAGWRARAQADLKLADESSIRKSQARLKRAGLIDFKPWEKAIRIRGEAF